MQLLLTQVIKYHAGGIIEAFEEFWEEKTTHLGRNEFLEPHTLHTHIFCQRSA